MRKRYLLSLSARILSAGGQALLLILIARTYSLQEMGTWGSSFAACMVIASLADFGNTTRALRLAADDLSARYLGLMASVRLALALTLPVGAWVVLFGLSASASLGFVAAGAAVFVVGESCAEAATCVWQGRLETNRIITFSLLRRLVIFVPFVGGISNEAITAAMCVNGATGAAGLVLATWGRAGRPMNYLEAMRRNLPYALAQAGPQVGQLDTLVVTAVTGIKTAGLYSLAARLNSPISIVVSSLVQVLVPEIARQQTDPDRYRVFVRVRRAGLAAAALVAVSSTAAPWVTMLIFGDTYGPAAPFVVAVVVGSAFSLLSQLHLAWFYGTDTPRALSGLILATAGVGLALIGTGGVFWGVPGIAAAYIATQGILTGIVVRFWYRRTRHLR